jgi:hypothetical protein
MFFEGRIETTIFTAYFSSTGGLDTAAETKPSAKTR